MTTRIGLVSDVHSSPGPLRQALEIFAREAVDDIVCAGDIAGYYEAVAPTVELLRSSGCKAIAGNHDLMYLAKPADQQDPRVRNYLARLPLALEFETEGKKVLVVHANPPAEQYGGIKLLDRHGNLVDERCRQWAGELDGADFDVLIVGHTHQVYAEQLGGVFVVNPGSSVFNHCCMILSLPDCSVTTHALGERDIIACWNFGMFFGGDDAQQSYPQGD